MKLMCTNNEKLSIDKVSRYHTTKQIDQEEWIIIKVITKQCSTKRVNNTLFYDLINFQTSGIKSLKSS